MASSTFGVEASKARSLTKHVRALLMNVVGSKRKNEDMMRATPLMAATLTSGSSSDKSPCMIYNKRETFFKKNLMPLK